MSEEMVIDDAEIERFWEDAKVRANLNRLRAYMGPSVSESLCPPAWSFGADPETADELVGLILDGTKTATASALRDYGDEELPSQGAMSIVTDGSGHPRVLIVTTHVQTVPFGEVSEEHARLEGEHDLSLDSWRGVHRTFFAETGVGGEVTDDLGVVLERFEVVWAP